MLERQALEDILKDPQIRFLFHGTPFRVKYYYTPLDIEPSSHIESLERRTRRDLQGGARRR